MACRSGETALNADDERRAATYLFDPESIRAAGEPPEDSARLIWMFLTLLRKPELDFARYSKQFGRGTKTFARDLAKLRDLGEKYGFALTKQRGGKATLSDLRDMPDTREKAAAAAADTLRAVADALGEVVANDVLGVVDVSAAPRDPFLRLASPRLVSGTQVSRTYRELRQAWQKHSRVRFRYPKSGAKGPRAETEERTVEPHLVTYYDGRYYLVAFDRRPRTAGWRQFALDRIEGPLAPAGTFEFRAVPAQYRGEDALGLFKSGGRFEVTIALSPAIAQAVLGRLWQRHQQVSEPPDGWVRITFEAYDLGEAVRWAFRFGAEARVVAPPEAVALARETAQTMLAALTEEGRHTA